VDIFDEIKSIGKKPIIAKIGGFRPEENIKSWFGGNFLIEKQMEWPKYNGKYMVPVIQIAVSEIPNGKDFFGDTEIVQVFIDRDRLPSGYPAKNGEGWLLHEIKTSEGLSRCETPDESDLYKKFQIRWEISQDEDYPCWEEAWDYYDLSEINESDELSDRFFDEFDQYDSSKIGGYAAYIQSPVKKGYRYVFQISTEEKPRFMVGDNGNIYFYKSNDNGEWHLNWDCY